MTEKTCLKFHVLAGTICYTVHCLPIFLFPILPLISFISFQAPCSYHVTPLTLLSEFHLPPHTHAKAICITVPHYVISADLELMLFFKEHPEGDDGAVDQYTADDGHHGCVPEDDSGVGEENWEGYLKREC